jgi:DNA-binding NtrC family response regulator
VKDDEKKKRLLIIDKQEYWRELSEKALRLAGFTVEVRDSYEWGAPGEQFDLIILGCAEIKRDEQKLIARILESGQHLLVLCTSLPWVVMRSLFLAGADDVASKPYDPERLTDIVQQALVTITPSDSYRATKQRGIR